MEERFKELTNRLVAPGQPAFSASELHELHDYITAEFDGNILPIIYEYMKEDCSHISFPQIVDAPKGTKEPTSCELFEYEYIDQHAGSCGDDYYGTTYFPLPNGKFLAVPYIC